MDSGKASDPSCGTATFPCKYVPQFSAATEMILKRINSGSTPLSGGLSSMGLSGKPAGYEDMKKTVLEGMKTSYRMENTPTGKYGPMPRSRQSMPRDSGIAGGRTSTPGTSASGGKGKGSVRRGGKAGGKRKRGARDDSEDEESEEENPANMSELGGDTDSGDEAHSVTEMPKITQSGRQIVKPTQYVPAAAEGPPRKKGLKRTQDHALCKRCGRGNSPQTNMIVSCDGCNLSWHQKCHEPHISDEETKDEASAWFCSNCSLKRGIKTKPLFDTLNHASDARKTTEEKRAYFNSLPHAQLVSLLMRTTTLHPMIPLFSPSGNQIHQSVPIQAYIPPRAQQAPPAPALEQKSSAQAQSAFHHSATTTAGLFSRAETHPSATMNFIRKIPPRYGTPSLPTYLTSFIHPSPPITNPPPSVRIPPTPTFLHASSIPRTLTPRHDTPNGITTESRESTPASPPYPKAGQGLMAKLGADDEDLEWMVDDDDYGAFSHVVYDENGRKVEENGVLV